MPRCALGKHTARTQVMSLNAPGDVTICTLLKRCGTFWKSGCVSGFKGQRPKTGAKDAKCEALVATLKQRREKKHRFRLWAADVAAAATHRRLIPDSGGADQRDGALGSGEGDGLGLAASFSVSSLQRRTNRRVSVQSWRAGVRWSCGHLR